MISDRPTLMYSSVIRWCNNRDDKQPHLKYGLKWVADGSSDWMVISGSVKSFFTIYTRKTKRDNKRRLSYGFMHLAQRFQKVYGNVHRINFCPLIGSVCLFTIGSWLACVVSARESSHWCTREVAKNERNARVARGEASRVLHIIIIIIIMTYQLYSFQRNEKEE